jgi:hypothetical protein
MNKAKEMDILTHDSYDSIKAFVSKIWVMRYWVRKKSVSIICLLMAFIFLTCEGCCLKLLYPDLDETLPVVLEVTLFLKALADEGAFKDLCQYIHSPFKAKLPLSHSFPYTVQFHAPIEEENTIYWFTIEKKEKNTDWEVLKMWKTDKRSKILDENLSLPTPEQQKRANEAVKKLLNPQPTPPPS